VRVVSLPYLQNSALFFCVSVVPHMTKILIFDVARDKRKVTVMCKTVNCALNPGTKCRICTCMQFLVALAYRLKHLKGNMQH
jgi:hypothetical protein